MIGTRILQLNLEIAKIIEAKVATCNTKIIFLPLCNSKLSIFVCEADLQILMLYVSSLVSHTCSKKRKNCSKNLYSSSYL